MRFGAGGVEVSEETIEPVVAVETSAPVAHLHEPRPDGCRRSVDGDAECGFVARQRHVSIAAHGARSSSSSVAPHVRHHRLNLFMPGSNAQSVPAAFAEMLEQRALPQPWRARLVRKIPQWCGKSTMRLADKSADLTRSVRVGTSCAHRAHGRCSYDQNHQRPRRHRFQ